MDSPRALQMTLIESMDSPGLYIVEAPMGEGKTEAALAGAYRRWTEGNERGLYFALPTQLTSNRIHERVFQFLENTVSTPSALALVHGNAWLCEKRVQPLEPNVPEKRDGTDPDQSLSSNQWFSDSRKSLLAPFGVGTIDQALMAAMPVKFSALRLFALAGKVVVIDEVHSYDPYTSALVDRAIEWLLETGSTVIVLSATLTASRRASLVAAARGGEQNVSLAYPLITKVTNGGVQTDTIVVKEAILSSKKVEIRTCLAEDKEWIGRVVEAAESGACVLIIRNTVALAQETFDQVRSQCRDLGIKFGLIHSRFTSFDREQQEGEWMRLLGKDSAGRPAGAVLIGTQVLEQSLDIDADFLVTDLAPTDLILQRIGRLHRHRRSRPSGCESPRCLILRPRVDWNRDEKEIEKALSPHGFVYPAFSLYLADEAWSNREMIQIPSEIRTILELSERKPERLPLGVLKLYQNLQEKIQKMKNTVWQNGVFKAPSVDDVEGSQTRWKRDSSGFLVLLKESPQENKEGVTLHFINGEKITFQREGFRFDLARLLQMNSVRIPFYVLKSVLRGYSHPSWLQDHLSNSVLAVLSEGGECCFCHAPEAVAYSFYYRPFKGVEYIRNNNIAIKAEEEDCSWY